MALGAHEPTRARLTSARRRGAATYTASSAQPRDALDSLVGVRRSEGGVFTQRRLEDPSPAGSTSIWSENTYARHRLGIDLDVSAALQMGYALA